MAGVNESVPGGRLTFVSSSSGDISFGKKETVQNISEVIRNIHGLEDCYHWLGMRHRISQMFQRFLESCRDKCYYRRDG